MLYPSHGAEQAVTINSATNKQSTADQIHVKSFFKEDALTVPPEQDIQLSSDPVLKDFIKLSNGAPGVNGPPRLIQTAGNPEGNLNGPSNRSPNEGGRSRGNHTSNKRSMVAMANRQGAWEVNPQPMHNTTQNWNTKTNWETPSGRDESSGNYDSLVQGRRG
jgi:hypothetical protein